MLGFTTEFSNTELNVNICVIQQKWNQLTFISCVVSKPIQSICISVFVSVKFNKLKKIKIRSSLKIYLVYLICLVNLYLAMNVGYLIDCIKLILRTDI